MGEWIKSLIGRLNKSKIVQEAKKTKEIPLRSAANSCTPTTNFSLDLDECTQFHYKALAKWWLPKFLASGSFLSLWKPHNSVFAGGCKFLTSSWPIIDSRRIYRGRAFPSIFRSAYVLFGICKFSLNITNVSSTLSVRTVVSDSETISYPEPSNFLRRMLDENEAPCKLILDNQSGSPKNWSFPEPPFSSSMRRKKLAGSGTRLTQKSYAFLKTMFTLKSIMECVFSDWSD